GLLLEEYYRYRCLRRDSIHLADEIAVQHEVTDDQRPACVIPAGKAVADSIEQALLHQLFRLSQFTQYVADKNMGLLDARGIVGRHDQIEIAQGSELAARAAGHADSGCAYLLGSFDGTHNIRAIAGGGKADDDIKR